MTRSAFKLRQRRQDRRVAYKRDKIVGKLPRCTRLFNVKWAKLISR